jgi:hypothetical protein
MSRIHPMKAFHSPDGTNWGVQVELAGASNALIVFHHPDGRTSRKDRYTSINWRGPEASNVQGHLDPAVVFASLTDATLATLFRRSALIGTGRGPAFSPA